MTSRRRRLAVTVVVGVSAIAVGAGAISVGAGWWGPVTGPAAVAATAASEPNPQSPAPLPTDPAASPGLSTSPSAMPSEAAPTTSAASVESAPPARDLVDRAWPKRPPWDACPAPVWPGATSSGEPGDGRRVLVLGDSLTRDSWRTTARLMRASGWTPTFRCWGSKRLDWGLDQARRAKSLGQLPGHVVVALGTNDISWESRPTNERRVREMLRVLGKKRQVLWLDVDTTYSSFSIAAADWFNQMIRRVAKDHPNVTIVPWKRTARSAGVRRWDGIHYGPDGYRLRARTVVEALNAQELRTVAASPSPGATSSVTSSPSASSPPLTSTGGVPAAD